MCHERNARARGIWAIGFAFGAAALVPAPLWAGGDGQGHGKEGTEHHAAAGGPGSLEAVDRVIEVELRDIAFDPRQINVVEGETVRFVVRNVGKLRHEFVLGDADEQREHAEQMREMGHQGIHQHSNAVSLAPAETGELVWRFNGSGAVQFACHEPGHYEAGMVGTVRIE